MTPADAIDWCLHRNADAPTCARLRDILPAVAAADATNRALLERVADLEKEVAAKAPLMVLKLRAAISDHNEQLGMLCESGCRNDDESLPCSTCPMQYTINIDDIE